MIHKTKVAPCPGMSVKQTIKVIINVIMQTDVAMALVGANMLLTYVSYVWMLREGATAAKSQRAHKGTQMSQPVRERERDVCTYYE